MEETTLSGRIPLDDSFITRKSDFQKSTRKERVLEILTYFFILLFTYAGLRKLVDLNMFVKEVWGFAIFGSKHAIKWQFLCLSSAELIVAVLLLLPKARYLGWYMTFTLMIVINISMFIMQQFAKVIPVYYGGVIPYVPFIVHFIFNILVLFISLYGLLISLESGKKST